MSDALVAWGAPQRNKSKGKGKAGSGGAGGGLSTKAAAAAGSSGQASSSVEKTMQTMPPGDVNTKQEEERHRIELQRQRKVEEERHRIELQRLRKEEEARLRRELQRQRKEEAAAALEAAAAAAVEQRRLKEEAAKVELQRLEEEMAVLDERRRQVQAQQAQLGGGTTVSVTNEEDYLCVLCLDAPKDHIIVPCGHQCVCGVCANKLAKTKTPQCPLCRGAIRETMKVFT
jgi:hypothetical protein